MHRAILCLTAEHATWALPLAGLVCWLSCHACLRLVEQARVVPTGASLMWLLGASFAAGAGIWSTHFIAMLGYRPDLEMGYDVAVTLASLLVGLTFGFAAVTVLDQVRRPAGAVLAGLIFGADVVAVHFTGMAALHVSGTFDWDPLLGAASVVIGSALACVGLLVFRQARTNLGRYAAATLLGSAVVSLHVLAMAAAEFKRNPRLAGIGGIPTVDLAIGVAVVMLAILACLVLALVAGRLRQINAVLEERTNALVSGEERLRALTDALPQMVWVATCDGRTIYANRKAQAFFGADMSRREERIAAHHPDDRAVAGEEWRSAEAAGRIFEIEARWRALDGRYRWHKIVIIPVRHDGAVVEWIGTALDIDDIVAAREAFRISEERLALALEAGSDGLWDCDLVTGAAWTSDHWWRPLGYAPGELPSAMETWRSLIHPEERHRVLRALEEHVAGASPVFECEHRLRRKDGDWGWVLHRAKVVERDGDGRALRLVGTQTDIAARKEAEGRIAHMATHDGLTDLANRTLFRERLRARLAALAHGGPACAVLCIDLDRFKVVNDLLGHRAGDALLREIGQRLRTALGPDDVAARLGGDEFAVLLSSVTDPRDVEMRAAALIGDLGRPIALSGQPMEVGASIGIAFAPEHGSDEELILKRADVALYKAKAEGRNLARSFDPAMDLLVTEQRRLEAEMRRAIARDDFVLHYQPQVRSDTAGLVGFEALVRWRHEVRGLVGPDAFIPLAEETGLIVALGDWVLRAACREAAGWDPALRIAVNLSPRQFHQSDLPERVLAILAEAGLPPERLEIEITETALINNMNRALATLRRLKSFGIRIAMDDFGTGYSSLATLQAFPFDKIKIDRSFVKQLPDRGPAVSIVRAVLGLGRSLGLDVVAEGVETPEQRDFLVSEGCDEMQGYLFGRPQPREALVALLDRNPGAPPSRGAERRSHPASAYR